ncbi:plastocyanin/azurin family copper-binding protein [Rhodohalobacter sp. 8-1]|uniref:plastocyanin/azurin family copper-binding protein n=1 Tax=Rhodohalobacter sp. 8-1 TaxID=3131972 RepID=UPI0030ED4827
MKKLLISTILMSFVFMLAACGGGGDTAEQTTGDMNEGTQMAETDDGTRTIELVGIDDLRFAVTEEHEGVVTSGSSGQYMIVESIEASPGEELRVNMRTVSNLPPTAMSHNFALLSQDANADEFARSSLQAADNSYISLEYEDWVIVATDMLGDGESDSVTFTVPEEPGTYQFICTFPGHYSGGMVGTLVVE